MQEEVCNCCLNTLGTGDERYNISIRATFTTRERRSNLHSSTEQIKEYVICKQCAKIAKFDTLSGIHDKITPVKESPYLKLLTRALEKLDIIRII